MTNRTRFSKELSEHLEDGGDPSALGEKELLLKSYNAYQSAKIVRKIMILVGVFMTTFMISSIALMAVNENTDSLISTYLPAPLLFTSIILGFVLTFPIFLMHIAHMAIVQLVIPTYDPEYLLPFIPLFAALFWTYVALVLTCSPKMLSDFFAKKYAFLKRNS